MTIHIVTITYLDSSTTDLRAFSSHNRAEAFLAETARELADERDEDFEPGEWFAYLMGLEEARVIEFQSGRTALDDEEA